MDSRWWARFSLTVWVSFVVAVLWLCVAVTANADDLVTMQKDPNQWVHAGKNYALTRYSELNQINTKTVKNLKVSWTFSTGVLRGHEGQPLVVGTMMYVVTPFPNVLYAFDLTQSGYPLKWKYRPDVDEAALGMACCDAINRGASYSQGKIVYNTLDGHTIAVDALTGREIWNVKVGDLSDGETMPMAPLEAIKICPQRCGSIACAGLERYVYISHTRMTVMMNTLANQ